MRKCPLHSPLICWWNRDLRNNLYWITSEACHSLHLVFLYVCLLVSVLVGCKIHSTVIRKPLHVNLLNINGSYPRGGGLSGTEGAAPALCISRKKGSFLRPPHARDFVKEGYFFVPRYDVWGSKSPWNPRNIRGSDAEWLPKWLCFRVCCRH